MEGVLLKSKEIGNLKKTPTEEIEWSVPGLDTIPCGYYKSLPFVAVDALWNFLFFLFEGKESSRIMLGSKVPREYPVHFKICLINADGNMQHLIRGIMKENETGSVMLDPHFNLPGPNIIRCTLWREITHSTQPTALDELRELRLKSVYSLPKKLKVLFNMKETCDTTLKVMGREYKAHRAILIAQSPVFAAMFVHDTTEKQTGIINIPDCDPCTFKEFLEYLYWGKLENISFCSALHLYVTSDKYEVLELKAFCVKFLESVLAVENICDIAVLADKYDEVDLFSAALNFFIENATKIFETRQWEFLMTTNFHLANKLLKEMPSET